MSNLFDVINQRIVIIDNSGVDEITMLACWKVFNEETNREQIQYPKSFILDIEGLKREYFIYRYNKKQDIMMYKEQ